MKFLEEVYTSAPRLLDASEGADLGVVARSEGFPDDVRRELEFLRSYHILEGIPLSDPESHPPRWVCALHGRQLDYYCLSRIVFAGADHTLRTTPLAHHVVFMREDIEKSGESPASLLLRSKPCFYSKWQGNPRSEPPKDFECLNAISSLEVFPSPIWDVFLERSQTNKLFATIAEQLLRFSQERKPVVCLIDIYNAISVAELMADLLRLLPKSSQLNQVCASHVISEADLPANASLVFSYPHSPFARDCARRNDPRAPYVFDLTDSQSLSLEAPKSYGVVLSEVLDLDNPVERINTIGQLFEKLDTNYQSLPLFPNAWRLFQDLNHVRCTADLSSCSERLSDVTRISGNAPEFFSRWCRRNVIDKRLVDFAEGDRWDALALIVKQGSWPSPVRDHAWGIIEREAVRGVPHLLKGVDRTASESNYLQPLLKRLVVNNAQVIPQLLTCAISGDHDSEIAASWLIDLAPIHASHLSEWIRESVAGSNHLPSFVLEPFATYCQRAVSSFTRRPQLQSVQLSEEFVAPLQSLLSCVGVQDEWWEEFAQCYLLVAANSSMPSDRLRWLQQKFPNECTSERLVRWIDSLGEQGAHLGQALSRAGLLTVAVESESTAHVQNPQTGSRTAESQSNDAPAIQFKRKRDAASFLQRFPPPFIQYLIGIVSLLLNVVSKGLSWPDSELVVPWASELLPKQSMLLVSVLCVVAIAIASLGVVTILSWGVSRLLSLVFGLTRQQINEMRDRQIRRLDWATLVLLVTSGGLLTAYGLKCERLSLLAGLVAVASIVCMLWIVDSTVRSSLCGAPPDRIRRVSIFRLTVFVMLLILSVIPTIHVVRHVLTAPSISQTK